MANNLTAQDVVTALTTTNGTAPAWVKQAACIVKPRKPNRAYKSTAANYFTEVTVRVPTIKTAKRNGKQYPGLQRRRLDLVAVIQPNKFSYQPIIAGIEIKVAMHDLENDTKIPEYLPYCDVFFIAVPPEMHAIAQIRAEKIEPERFTVGVIVCYDDGPEITRWPHALAPETQHLKEIYAELLLKPLRGEQ